MNTEVEIAGSFAVLFDVGKTELSHNFIDLITFDDVGNNPERCFCITSRHKLDQRLLTVIW